MKEFVLLFRMDILTEKAQPTQQQMKIYMQQWMQWIAEIGDKGQLADGGNHLQYSGKVIHSKNGITDKPYVSNNESVAGYIIVLAKNIDDALSIAEKCPILNGEGNSVEIREVGKP